MRTEAQGEGRREGPQGKVSERGKQYQPIAPGDRVLRQPWITSDTQPTNAMKICVSISL